MIVEEIGSILQEAREARGLSHAQVHDSLRINPKYLKAMEGGHFDALPSPTHVRGYLRKYARYLDLDAEPLLERYEHFRQQQPPPAQQAKNGAAPTPPPLVLPPEPENGTFFNPINAEIHTDPNEGRGDRVGWFIIAALIVFITLLSWRFVPMMLGVEGENSSLEALTGAVNTILGRTTEEDPLAGDQAAGEAAGAESSDQAEGTMTELIVPTGRTTGSSIEIPRSSSELLPPPTPTRNPLPATIDIINMQIDVTERAWLRVIVDDINVFEGQAVRGEVLTFTGGDYINIRTGNASGVVVRINDIDIGRLGERGQVVDQTWETTE